jgi:hypothetical protein
MISVQHSRMQKRIFGILFLLVCMLSLITIGEAVDKLPPSLKGNLKSSGINLKSVMYINLVIYMYSYIQKIIGHS